MIDLILYINITHRADRKKRIETEIRKITEKTKNCKIERIRATYDIKNGHRGCAKSHINALKYAKTQNGLKSWELEWYILMY